MQKGVWYVVIINGACHYFERHGHQRRPGLDFDIEAPENGVLVVMGSAVEWALDARLHIVLDVASQEGNGADTVGFVGSARKV